ncbi:hypothetical protein PsorP6_002369 [Peronosclerospora sorghi]|uniref:Uncharacterized protein n=1 Tax=Peronosclerospora sorghi TaxID=230839 RepID=A0ACC0WU30_9STRA|nr:hypothetical protein PsorP6_002369 [Peronosclerospora sorghi]
MASKKRRKRDLQHPQQHLSPSGGRPTHFNTVDYDRICSYIESPVNYENLFGSGKTKITGNVLSKNKAFDALAYWLNKERNKKAKNVAIPRLTGRQMQQGFATYKQKYHKAKLLRTGDGVTDEYIARGILTVDQKRNCICPQYARMDAVFETKANVTAMAEYDSCLLASSEEEDDREENDDDEEDENEFDTFLATNFEVPPGTNELNVASIPEPIDMASPAPSTSATIRPTTAAKNNQKSVKEWNP